MDQKKYTFQGIQSDSNNAYGIFSNSGYLTLNSDEPKSQEQNIQIKSISGINAYGFRINDADTSMNSGALLVQDITASGSNGTAAALSINTKNNNGTFRFNAPSLSASNIVANGTATGIRLQGSLESNFETVSISDISGSSAYALNISGDNNLVTIGSLNTWNIHSNSLETASNSECRKSARNHYQC